jgi:N-acetylmuramoyl-L-alanine amidase
VRPRIETTLCLLLLASCVAPIVEPAGTERPGEPVATRRPPIAIPTPRPEFWVEAPIEGDPTPVFAQVPETGAKIEGNTVRLLRPPIADTPRRVAIQAGHLFVADAPAEFPNLRFSNGASVAGVNEVDVTRDIAERVAGLLRPRGYNVDILPATIPPSYLADVFVALHADGDVTGTARGFKIAHGTYRQPYDALLVEHLNARYAAGTGLPPSTPITADMLDYYAFAWFRYVHSLAPHTAAAILEMGFLSHPADRAVMVNEPDRIASAIADGIVAFLDAVPRSVLFGEDVVVPLASPPAATPQASAP